MQKLHTCRFTLLRQARSHQDDRPRLSRPCRSYDSTESCSHTSHANLLSRGFKLCHNQPTHHQHKKMRVSDERLKLYQKDYPFAYDLVTNENTFIQALEDKRFYLKGTTVATNSGYDHNWFHSIFGTQRNVLLYKARAMDVIFVPWLCISLNAIVWTSLVKCDVVSGLDSGVDDADNLFITACLTFLLVFRLNRVAIRWWDTRRMWGVIVEQMRTLTSEILEHVQHAPENRDNAIRWICAFCIMVKYHLRIPDRDTAGNENNKKNYDLKELEGILTDKQIHELVNNEDSSLYDHPGLYCMSECRHVLKKALKIDENTPIGLASAYSSEMRRLEIGLHSLIAQVGGMERVKATPLPLAYITHMRTILFVHFLALPYLKALEWGWATMPFTILLSYALLGIDAAASDCEVPFTANHVNHLDMDGYCIAALKNVTQLVCHSADMNIRDNKLKNTSDELC